MVRIGPNECTLSSRSSFLTKMIQFTQFQFKIPNYSGGSFKASNCSFSVTPIISKILEPQNKGREREREREISNHQIFECPIFVLGLIYQRSSSKNPLKNSQLVRKPKKMIYMLASNTKTMPTSLKKFQVTRR